jgi:excisionase family DNA binding protein
VSEDGRLLTAREVAELLGFSAATIVDWSEQGRIPGFKVGGRLRFRESEVLTWLETCRVARHVPSRAGGDGTTRAPFEVVQ